MKRIQLIFLLAPFCTVAQEELPPEPAATEDPQSRFSAGLMVMPEYIGLIRAQPTDDKHVVLKFGFSTGVNLEFAMTPRLSLRTGLGYGQKSLGLDQTGLVFNSDVEHYIETGTATESRMESTYLFSEIQFPVKVQYEIIEDRFFLAGGTEIIFMMPSDQSRHTIYYGNGTVEELPINNGNQTNVSVLISGGYKFHFARNLNLALEPMLRYCLIPYPIEDGVVYSFGLKTTLNMEF